MLTRSPLRLLALPAAVFATACAPTLHITRPGPPEGTFGTVRTMSLDVATDMGKAVENSVVTGLLTGEIPIPVPVHSAVRRHLEERLTGLGYVICPTAPCGDGSMTVRLTESSVNSELTRNGMRAHVRINMRVVVKQNDGTEPYDFTFWDRRSGRPEEAPLMVDGSADSVAARLERSLLPSQIASTLPLEDGGPLSTGVNMLLSSNWDGAIANFTQLTREQPDNAAAWYDLGVAWEARGDWAQALSAYEQAAARDRKRSYRDAVNTARRNAPPPQQLQTVPQRIP